MQTKIVCKDCGEELELVDVETTPLNTIIAKVKRCNLCFKDLENNASEDAEQISRLTEKLRNMRKQVVEATNTEDDEGL